MIRNFRHISAQKNNLSRYKEMKLKSYRLRLAAILSLLPLLLVTELGTVRSQVSSTTWYKPQQVKRQGKPKRVPRKRRPPVQLAPLLTVQYRVLIRRPDGS